jgi:glutaminyl-peptide cyclotransferase
MKEIERQDGRIILVAAVLCCMIGSCRGHDSFSQGRNDNVPSVAPHIKSTIPHDSQAFTQGLFYDNGRLYESTGLYGKSSLRILDASTGAIVKNMPVDKVFAEGCTSLGNELYQITWQEDIAFVYTFPGLKEQRTVIYAGEGWGLTSDGNYFYMSTGSDTLFVRDREFAVVRKIPVRMNHQPVNRLNELEYVDGFIYANVWYTDFILQINAKSGKVVRKIDCSALVKIENPSSQENVLNGIAYNPQSNDFYITGKNWKNIFVVEIPRK